MSDNTFDKVMSADGTMHILPLRMNFKLDKDDLELDVDMLFVDPNGQAVTCFGPDTQSGSRDVHTLSLTQSIGGHFYLDYIKQPAVLALIGEDVLRARLAA